jgi:HK97 family phage portal protein
MEKTMQFFKRWWQGANKHRPAQSIAKVPAQKQFQKRFHVQQTQPSARFTPRQYDRLADEGYQKNVIAYRCVSLLSQNAAFVPFIYKRDNGEVIEDMAHPLIALMNRPNPWQSRHEFIMTLAAYYLIAGNAFVQKITVDEGAPKELYCLRPDRVHVLSGEAGGILGYRYQAGARAVDFPCDRLSGVCDILHVKAFHPLNDYYGMSPLEAAAMAIDQHNEAGKWNAALLQNAGRPSGALIYDSEDQMPLSDDQRNILRQELEQFYTQSQNAGRPMILEGGLDWKEMSLSPKDIDFIAGKDISAREIALAFHVPPQLIGIEGSLTFANFEQARLALFDDGVLPLITHVIDELNMWLKPYFDDVRIEIDLNKIEALAPRREMAWKRIADCGFLTDAEKRKMLGLAEV